MTSGKIRGCPPDNKYIAINDFNSLFTLSLITLNRSEGGSSIFCQTKPRFKGISQLWFDRISQESDF